MHGPTEAMQKAPLSGNSTGPLEVMVNSVFDRVRVAISQDPERIARALGVQAKKGDKRISGGGFTTGFICPLCDDKSGSASFTRELYLKCHQCGTKLDVFDWVGKKRGQKSWDVCKDLAKELGVENETTPWRGRQLPLRMTHELMERSIEQLWESDHAEPIRQFLRERKLDDQVWLARLGIGFLHGYLIFPQFLEDGTLLDRYRTYLPGGRNKWGWIGRGRGGPGLWPLHLKPLEGAPILLMEGEFDVATALIRLRLSEAGYHSYTWTGGAGSSPHPRDIPRSWHHHDVHLMYDNDVFQGPEYDRYWWPDKKGERKVKMLRKQLLEKTAPAFEAVRCNVIIRKCPVPPDKVFGGDFRDWVDGGGHDLNDWKAYPFQKLPALKRPAADVTFDEVFDGYLHEEVRFQTQVDRLHGDDIPLWSTVQMNCQMGQLSYCRDCPATKNFPDTIIHLEENFDRERAVAMELDNPEKYLLQNVVKKPKACPQCELVPLDGGTGSKWTGVRPGSTDDTRQRVVSFVSKDQPSLSGEVEVTGTVYPKSSKNGLMVIASKVVSLDKADIDLQPYADKLRSICPFDRPTVDDIEDYLTTRWLDLSANVTKIHGRRDIQIAHDLLAHSTIKMHVDGAPTRAWLDICVLGDTRSGKSQTFRRMFEHHRLGVAHSAVDNISRAGLVMGCDRHNMMKPGLFPKCHRKMLLLDEFHWLVSRSRDPNSHPMSWLQAARDQGVVHGVKIYGDRVLPSNTRFCAIGNWIKNRRKTFEHAAEHFGALYGAPETLARLDFGLIVQGPPSQDDLDEDVEHLWDGMITRALILRAWSQDVDDVVIDREATNLAFEFAKSWRELYSYDELPLYTPEEKAFSLLRTAIACANLRFSHKNDDLRVVYVRKVDVEWAAQFYQRLWEESGYARYSQVMIMRDTVDSPFDAERMLTCKLGLDDPDYAESVLSTFRSPFSMPELQATLSMENYELVKWIGRTKGLKVFRTRRHNNGYNVEFCTTKGGDRILENLLMLCRDYPEEYVKRYQRLNQWLPAGKSGPDPSGMMPLSLDPDEVFDGLSFGE